MNTSVDAMALTATVPARSPVPGGSRAAWTRSVRYAGCTTSIALETGPSAASAALSTSASSACRIASSAVRPRSSAETRSFNFGPPSPLKWPR